MSELEIILLVLNVLLAIAIFYQYSQNSILSFKSSYFRTKLLSRMDNFNEKTREEIKAVSEIKTLYQLLDYIKDK